MLPRFLFALLVSAAFAGGAAAQTGSKLTDAEAKAAVDFHNTTRSEVGAPPLKWDATVAAYAQEWADKLAREDKGLMHRSDHKYGENIAGGGGPLTIVGSCELWKAEKAKYDGSAISRTNFLVFGHYTQMIWGATTALGMGKATSTAGRTYVVANYSPPGNFIGQMPVTTKFNPKDPVVIKPKPEDKKPAVANAPDFRLNPLAGTIRTKAGFGNISRDVPAGGKLATNLGGVNSHVTPAPTFRFIYTAGASPLVFQVKSAGDTTLLINLPDGKWIADDDSGGNLNPMLRFEKPQSGQYDVWVGTFNSAALPGKLLITETAAPPKIPPKANPKFQPAVDPK